MQQFMDPSSLIIPTAGNSMAGNINAGNATLFLFSPRNIINHFKRPLVYNFNNELVESITQNIIERPNYASSISNVLNGTPSASQSIIPSADGTQLNTAMYSDHWMFVFIFDEDPRKNMIITTMSNKLTTRTILIGICAHEPMSHSALSSMTPEQFLNPNCQLIVTKRLQMSKYQTAGVNGPSHKIKTVANDNVIHFDDNVWGASQQQFNEANNFFTLKPFDVQTASDVNEMGSTSCVDFGNSLNIKRYDKIHADLESPRRHMKELLSSVESGSMHNAFDEGAGGFSDGIGIAGFNNPEDDFRNCVVSSLKERHMSYNASFGNNVSDITQTFLTIGMVMQNYNPQVYPIITPVHSNADIIPQHDPTINSVFSSLVCAVIPSYLNELGLSSIAFMYHSPMKAYQLLDIKSSLNMSQQEFQYKWGALQYLMNTELFPTLLGNGEFDLQVNGSVNATVDVVLNFLDWEQLPMGAIYQENAVLGGIVSPMVGTADYLKRNSVQLNGLIHAISSNINPNRIH